VLEGVVRNNVLDRLRRERRFSGAGGSKVAGHSSLRGETAGYVGIFRQAVEAWKGSEERHNFASSRNPSERASALEDYARYIE